VGSNYYRSLVTKPTMTTTAVTNAVGDTGADPTSLVVPGRAQVLADATPLLASPAASTTDPTTLDLAAGTRLKTIAVAVPATSTSPALIQVEGLDDPAINGYVSADRLAPKDSRAPVVIGIDSGGARFSPNGDGRSDTQDVSALFSEPVSWTMEFSDGAGNVVGTASGSGRELTVTWDGLVAGVAVPDGTYRWTLRGTDAWLNGVGTGAGLLVVDTAPPTLTNLSPDGSTVSTFSPNADGASDTVATSATTDEAGSFVVRVSDAADATVRTFSVTAPVGTTKVTWDGRANGGSIVPDGDYTITIAPRDAAGNTGVGLSRPVRVVTLLGFVRNSTKVFYPNDLDRFARTTTLSFALTRPATVTWILRNAANQVVLTRLDAVAAPAGTQTWVFDGRLPSGAMLPRGMYVSVVTATDGTFTVSQAVRVELNAFAITPSTLTPVRGGRVTITVISAEALSTSVRLYVSEPGLSTWAVTMTRLDSRTYRATITLKKGGSAGTLRLKVWARDYDGRSQATYRYLPLA
jgi:flagellar hook assembly protein FlgD